jgi:hypothetical protein
MRSSHVVVCHKKLITYWIGAYLKLFWCDYTTYKSVEVNWFDVSESVTNKAELKDVLKKGDKVCRSLISLIRIITFS